MEDIINKMNNIIINEPQIHDLIYFKLNYNYYYAVIIDITNTHYYIKLLDNNRVYNIHKQDLLELQIIELNYKNIKKISEYINEEINPDYITSWIDLFGYF